MIYGYSSEVGSDHSSRLQAEVQRQLEEYTSKYQEELRSLQVEVERLRLERREWEMRARAPDGAEGELQNASENAEGHCCPEATSPFQSVVWRGNQHSGVACGHLV